MTVALSFLLAGIVLVFYAYLSYKKADHKLAEIKKEDLVSYYLDLILHLLPVPFWSFILGVVAILVGLILVIINIPIII